MRAIVHIGDPVLRTVAQTIPVEDIPSPDMQQIISDMQEALANERFGVAIAAPQIGESLQLFVVAGKTLASRKKETYDETLHKDEVFINPKILKTSKKMHMGNEGCLSVPGKYGPKVERPEKMTIEYYDETGEKHERGASGFLARIFQHEIDHLNGILYIDHALEVIDVDEDLQPVN